MAREAGVMWISVDWEIKTDSGTHVLGHTWAIDSTLLDDDREFQFAMRKMTEHFIKAVHA